MCQLYLETQKWYKLIENNHHRKKQQKIKTICICKKLIVILEMHPAVTLRRFRKHLMENYMVMIKAGAI